MPSNALIKWTGSTWNPVTGCTKISEGCRNCYAERMAKRLAGRYGYARENPFKVTLHADRLSVPLKRRKPHTFFVCSMGDIFHDDVPETYLLEVLDVIRRCPAHTFQILTKRERRLVDFSRRKIGRWPGNAWLGVTLENRTCIQRIEALKKIDASVKFLCCEPLLKDLGDIDLSGIDWVIVGGESGVAARPMADEWAINLRDRCLEKTIPFFFKQCGGKNKKKTGRKLEGREWDQMPEIPVKQL